MQSQRFDWLSGYGTLYMSHYTIPEKWHPLNCLLVVLTKQNQQNLAIFVDDF